ncbi:hypothetical protein NECAME_17556 [Necator americanus]|uniref:Uncharacterized protein n=1 Tax=Necator americanus TaxID=51031 RepID=W2TN41_NECAM|nr:hypothetical protein NECAME_17556 [Necator americanus]ETN83188.1 hypothetical protein NECAME_17556 [Necator americanus]
MFVALTQWNTVVCYTNQRRKAEINEETLKKRSRRRVIKCQQRSARPCLSFVDIAAYVYSSYFREAHI